MSRQEQPPNAPTVNVTVSACCPWCGFRMRGWPQSRASEFASVMEKHMDKCRSFAKKEKTS